MKKSNISEVLAGISEYWQPHIIAELNGQEVKLARIKGEFDWHYHADADELFYIVSGMLLMRLRTGDVELNQGDVFVVPRGVEHQPVAKDEVEIMLFEPAGTLNTGNIRSERTVDQPKRI